MPSGSFHSFIIDFLKDALFVPLLTNETYMLGFFWGMLVALIIGLISRFILWARKLIFAFFNPTKVPATNPGPSGYSRLKGCLLATAVLIGAITLTMIILAV